MNKASVKRFVKYALRWQLSSPILAGCIILLPFGAWTETVIANFIGACLLYKVDKLIFKEKETEGERGRMSEWIKVKDRLPWCFDARGKTGFGIYQRELRDEGWFTGGGVGEDSVTITHWMPLPEPPEEGKRNE